MHDNDDLVEAWHSLATRLRHRRDAEAEDYLQEAVVAALDERRRTGRAPAAATAWLRTVARRREVDHVRRAQCERRVAIAFAEEVDEDVAHDVVEQHAARWLARHVEQLPPTTRDVVHRLAEGRTQSDVANELSLTPRAVEAHVRRARIALRRVQERAGAVVALLLGGRRWRKTLPVTAAGVATAVGVAMTGTPDSHSLLPLPPKPRVQQAPDPDLPGRGGVLAPQPAGGGPAAVALPRTDKGVGNDVRPQPKPKPPTTSAPPSEPDIAGTHLALANAKGTNAPTTFATEAGALYEVTVSGIYTYNGGKSLADCGHLEPEDAEGWHAYEALLVDGVGAPCSRMAFDPTHVYRWNVVGTGKIVTFRVQDFGYKGDNVGGLVISMKKLSRG